MRPPYVTIADEQPPLSDSFLHVDTSYARLQTGGDMFSHNIGKIDNSGTRNTFTINHYPQLSTPKRQPVPRCPPASANFVGRARELDVMTRFFFGEEVSIHQRRVFLVIGMGGCGKTQLVRRFMELVYHRLKEKPTQLVFYVDAATHETIRASFISIAHANGLGPSTDAALEWMSNLDEPFYLYIDNGDDHTMNLRDYFPRSSHSRILITTRLRDAKQKYGTGRESAIYLDPLSDEEAVDLLLRTADLDSMQEQKLSLELVQELHHHPLAIVQAGAAIFKVQWTVEEYLAKFRQMRTSFMDGKRDRVEASAIDDYPAHVYTTWKLSYDRLSTPTAALLGILALFHHTGIREDIFARSFQVLSNHIGTDHDLRKPIIPFEAEEQTALEFLDSFSKDDAWNRDAFRWSIQEACTFSLLSYDPTTHLYSIHPLIHDFLRSVAPHPSQAAFLLAAASQSAWEDPVASSVLVPHIQRLLHCWTNWQTTAPFKLHPMLAKCLAQPFHHSGRAEEAEGLQRLALAGFTGSTGYRHLVLMARSDLAVSIGRTGRFDEADRMLTDLLEETRVGMGEDNPYCLKLMTNLAWTRRTLGRLEEAETLGRSVLETTESAKGPNDESTISALAELASTLFTLGRHEDAEDAGKRVVDWRREYLGVDHPSTIESMGFLATNYRCLGRFEDARILASDVLEWCQRVLGADHPSTLAAMHGVALTLTYLGRGAEAEDMARVVLEKSQRTLGAKHPRTITALVHLGWILGSCGRYGEAEPVQREAVEMRREVLGEGHPGTGLARRNLGRTVERLEADDTLEMCTVDSADSDSSSRVYVDAYASTDLLPPPDSAFRLSAPNPVTYGRIARRRAHGSTDLLPLPQSTFPLLSTPDEMYEPRRRPSSPLDGPDPHHDGSDSGFLTTSTPPPSDTPNLPRLDPPSVDTQVHSATDGGEMETEGKSGKRRRSFLSRISSPFRSRERSKSPGVTSSVGQLKMGDSR